MRMEALFAAAALQMQSMKMAKFLLFLVLCNLWCYHVAYAQIAGATTRHPFKTTRPPIRATTMPPIRATTIRAMTRAPTRDVAETNAPTRAAATRDLSPTRAPTRDTVAPTRTSNIRTLAPPRCPTTVEQLFREGCARGCITVTRASFPCPVCMDGCSTDAPEVNDECRPTDQSSCEDAEICLAVGVAGRYNCVDRLMAGENCSAGLDSVVEDFFRRTNLLDGVGARDRIHQSSEIAVPCRIGLVCQRESLTRRVCRAESGPCPTARRSDSQLQCDEDGSYRPLQCRKMAGSRTYQCQCVVPSTGTAVRKTQVEVSSLADGPDCDDMVLRRCRYRSTLGAMYDVRSGEKFIDPRNCSRCLCRDGMATLCQSLGERSCARLNPMPITDRNCTIRGRTLTNGASVAVDCNRCACRNGVLACTRRECSRDEQVGDDVEDPVEERNCRSCGMMRPQPVCGVDGRMYPSMCFAVSCRGLSMDELTPGSCTRRNVCGENPCQDGEVCMKSGGVTCLSREGCRPERLRRCVELDTLRCRSRESDGDDDEAMTTGENQDQDNGDGPGDGPDDDDDESVCGRDGRTHSSICNLIQNSPQTEVAYAGRCNRTECAGGQVCGTDGETYDNICELRSNSANARVDYRGECTSAETDEVVNDMCTRLRSSGRCANLQGCRSRIRPGDGCCPVCGGGVTIGLDSDAVDEYVRLNPSVDTVDEVLKVLVASHFIPEDIVRHCRVAANLLRTGDLHVLLESINGSSTDNVCAMAADQIAEKINNPPTAGDGDNVTTTAYPQILQFATVAQTSPQVEETGSLSDGAVSVISFSLAIMLLPIMALLM